MLNACAPTTTTPYPAKAIVHSFSHRLLQDPSDCFSLADSLSPLETYSYAYDSIYSGFITRWFTSENTQNSCKALEQYQLIGCFAPDLKAIQAAIALEEIAKVYLEITAFKPKVFPVYLLKTTAWNSAVFQKINQPVAQQQATFQVLKVLSPWQSANEFQFCVKKDLITAPLSIPHRSRFSIPLQQPFQVDVTREFIEMLQKSPDSNTGFCIAPTSPEINYQANNKIMGSFEVRFHVQVKK